MSKQIYQRAVPQQFYSTQSGHRSKNANRRTYLSATLLRRPTTDNREAWRVYWEARNQLWRKEPEIDQKRQVYLAQHRTTTPDIKQGIYPFKGMRLSRADIEWLLATHENGRGPVDWNDVRQRKREGLDLRGADLRGVDLSNLPLARLCAGRAQDLQFQSSISKQPEQHVVACTHLEGANLYGAHLEGAELCGVHLEEASLTAAYLEEANLSWTHLERASFQASHMEHANLIGAHMEGATLNAAYMESATLMSAHLEATCLIDTHLEHSCLAEAHLEGANLFRGHLEGATLYGAHLEGKKVASEDLERVRKWEKDFPELLLPASLQEAYFDATTRLSETVLSDKRYGSVSLADVNWNGVNLEVIDWAQITMLGEECEARRKRSNHSGSAKEKPLRLNEYRRAARTYRQLTVALQTQGLHGEAARFTYRAQKLQRVESRLQGKVISYIFSWLLDLLAGYGCRPLRSIVAYLLVVGAFAILYFLIGQANHLPFSPLAAIMYSVGAFHGRGFFLGSTQLETPVAILSALEAVMGFIIEIILIAVFVQHLLKK